MIRCPLAVTTSCPMTITSVSGRDEPLAMRLVTYLWVIVNGRCSRCHPRRSGRGRAAHQFDARVVRCEEAEPGRLRTHAGGVAVKPVMDGGLLPLSRFVGHVLAHDDVHDVPRPSSSGRQFGRVPHRRRSVRRGTATSTRSPNRSVATLRITKSAAAPEDAACSGGWCAVRWLPPSSAPGVLRAPRALSPWTTTSTRTPALHSCSSIGCLADSRFAWKGAAPAVAHATTARRV